MTTIEILKKTRELLSDPARWCKGSFHSDGKFCTLGALFFFASDVSSAYQALDVGNIVIWNDAPERTHAEVLQRFDEAIARLEAAG